jgi:flagellar assembly protein FliH
MWSHASVASAGRLSEFAMPRDGASFRPWTSSTPPGFTQTAMGEAEPDFEEEDEDEQHIQPIDPIGAAYIQGLTDGRATAEKEVAAERAALVTLCESLDALQPEPPHELGAMLAETVERLVRQIVGEVALDTGMLRARALNAATIIAEEASPAKMRLNPADFERLKDTRLPVELVADSHVGVGTVRLETAEGWIEDGPEVGIEKLRIALDRMGVAR